MSSESAAKSPENTGNSGSPIGFQSKAFAANIAVRSNIYVRNGLLVEDAAFIRQVRGRVALSKVARLHHRVRRLFTHRQIAEIAWERRCFRCGAIPEGVVLRNARETVQFRCPLGECKHSETKARTIHMERRLLDAVTQKYQLPISECLLQIIGTVQPKDLTASRRTGTVPVTLRLPLSVHYFYTDEELIGLFKAAVDEGH